MDLSSKASRLLARILILTVGVSSVVSVEPGTSQASCDTSSAAGNYVPDSGAISAAGPYSSNRYHAILEFSLTAEQIRNHLCLGEYLEIDFQVQDPGLPPYWDSYSIESNLPGAVKDTNLSDSPFDHIKHPNAIRYLAQRVLIVEIDGYAYLIPYIEDEIKIFFKTIIPSRKATKKYLKGNAK
ncbi:MAG TPA: hypothetical protein VFT87_00270 [Candidatus Saccharimonadales bacterium]|nr:hypothetical protein [Candidatus Saccharimonadales bacterium]